MSSVEVPLTSSLSVTETSVCEIGAPWSSGGVHRMKISVFLRSSSEMSTASTGSVGWAGTACVCAGYGISVQLLSGTPSRPISPHISRAHTQLVSPSPSALHAVMLIRYEVPFASPDSV